MIDKATVKHVAELSRLRLSDDEADLFSRELDEVLKNFRILDELDLDGVEPSFHPIRTEDRVREDKVEKSLDRDVVMNLAVHSEDGYFKVSRIV